MWTFKCQFNKNMVSEFICVCVLVQDDIRSVFGDEKRVHAHMIIIAKKRILRLISGDPKITINKDTCQKIKIVTNLNTNNKDQKNQNLFTVLRYHWHVEKTRKPSTTNRVLQYYSVF